MNHDIATTALACILSLGCGLAWGHALARRITRDEIIRKAAELKRQRDEMERIALGLRDGLIDASGRRVKLLAPSALRKASHEQLIAIAKQRGLPHSFGLDTETAEMAALRDAIEMFQRRLTEGAKIDDRRPRTIEEIEIREGAILPNTNDGPNEGRRYT